MVSIYHVHEPPPSSMAGSVSPRCWTSLGPNRSARGVIPLLGRRGCWPSCDVSIRSPLALAHPATSHEPDFSWRT